MTAASQRQADLPEKIKRMEHEVRVRERIIQAMEKRRKDYSEGFRSSIESKDAWRRDSYGRGILFINRAIPTLEAEIKFAKGSIDRYKGEMDQMNGRLDDIWADLQKHGDRQNRLESDAWWKEFEA
jgi:predicted  nucleic acid-binding Zn-ribbon protein